LDWESLKLWLGTEQKAVAVGDQELYQDQPVQALPLVETAVQDLGMHSAKADGSLEAVEELVGSVTAKLLHCAEPHHSVVARARN
jgi:hypothetical protein